MPSEENPEYRKVEEGKGGKTRTFMIVCDEGWRESIVCTGMYEWAADWFVGVVQGKPYGNNIFNERNEVEKTTIVR